MSTTEAEVPGTLPSGELAPARSQEQHAGGRGIDDAEAAGEGLGRLIEILNDGSLALLLSVGHQTGLLDVMASMPPSGSHHIADAAGLNERYVREWLAGMTTGGFVQFDRSEVTYTLTPAYLPFIVGQGVDNLARALQVISMMGEVTPKVVNAFRNGGGLSYDDYPGFHHLQAEDSAAIYDASLVDGILPLTRCVESLSSGIAVADIGCGEGHAINLMARAFPASTFHGYDFSPEAIDAARSEAFRMGLGNARFELQDVSELAVSKAFDLVLAFDAIHDQAHPASVLRNIHQALRPGGTFLMVDIKASSRLEENLDLPWATFLYTISAFHCMSVSLGQNGDGLGTVWGVQLAESMLHDAGFDIVEIKELETDPFNAYFVARKSA